MSKNIVVFAAHPDDEALGCSGTLSRHVDDGDNVFIVFMADGETSRHTNKVELSDRKDSAYRSCEIIGCHKPEFIDYPDNRMDTVEFLDIVKKVEYFINKYKPLIVYTHYQNDLNIDHQITYRATMTACRPQPSFCVKEIYSFEVLSSTEWSLESVFNPKKFVDISNTLSRKLDALDEYASEMRSFPHTRSKDAVLALAKLRGSSVGVKSAEAFQIERFLS
mgnify:FL=1